MLSLSVTLAQPACYPSAIPLPRIHHVQLRRSPLDKAATLCLQVHQLSFSIQHPAALHRISWPVGESDTFIRRIVYIVVQHVVREGEGLHCTSRVPDGEVCIGAWQQAALLRVEAIQLGRIGRGKLHKALRAEAPLLEAFVEQRQPRLYAWTAIRNMPRLRVSRWQCDRESNLLEVTLLVLHEVLVVAIFRHCLQR